jgi:hypothetical protein
MVHFEQRYKVDRYRCVLRILLERVANLDMIRLDNLLQVQFLVFILRLKFSFFWGGGGGGGGCGWFPNQIGSFQVTDSFMVVAIRAKVFCTSSLFFLLFFFFFLSVKIGVL